jgi:CheY-like chemotaxis protein/HPt (histidine-containing phosphotransfer) domain-containing protein
VVIAEHGRTAVEHARAGHFDVILMDCQMPVMDGYAATTEIRREESTGGKPRTTIIALTANALTRDRERCLAVGMDAFLAKPFTQAQLAQMLRPIAEARGTLRPPRAAGTPASAAEPAPQILDDDDPEPTIETRDLSATATITLLDTGLFEELPSPSVAVLDEEQVKAIRSIGKPQIFERLCDMLFVSGPESLRQIAAALEAGDLKAAAAAAHSMKSAVNNLGGRRLAEQLDVLENGIMDRADLEAARRAAGGLEQSYAQLEKALREQVRRETGT